MCTGSILYLFADSRHGDWCCRCLFFPLALHLHLSCSSWQPICPVSVTMCVYVCVFKSKEWKGLQVLYAGGLGLSMWFTVQQCEAENGRQGMLSIHGHGTGKGVCVCVHIQYIHKKTLRNFYQDTELPFVLLGHGMIYDMQPYWLCVVVSVCEVWKKQQKNKTRGNAFCRTMPPAGSVRYGSCHIHTAWIKATLRNKHLLSGILQRNPVTVSTCASHISGN